ncbi:MAG: hypothetical protein M3Z92_04380 [Bacteroidota bacterium]|nr:hypothetical protein [Bacteroidota bacterium]
MPDIHPQFIKDTAGENLVVLSQNEFNILMEELQELEDIRLYDEVKKNDTGERIAAQDAFKMIEAKRKNS